MKKNQLAIPLHALADPESFEIARLWAASGKLDVVINADLVGGAADAGELLSDLFEHLARMFAQREGLPLENCRQAMLTEFLRLAAQPNPAITGEIPVDQ